MVRHNLVVPIPLLKNIKMQTPRHYVKKRNEKCFFCSFLNDISHKESGATLMQKTLFVREV